MTAVTVVANPTSPAIGTVATPQPSPQPSSQAPATPAAPVALTPAQATAPITTDQSPPPVVAPAAPVRYRLDPGAGAIYVQVYKDPDTLAAGLSHDHVIVAKGWTGTVVWTPDDLSACSIDIRVPVNSLQNDASEWRTRVGYDTTLSESQRAEVRDHMIGSSQLDAARYPEITFRSTGCARDGDRYAVTGTLSVHGKSQTVTIKMKISGDGARFSASGTLKFKQSSFGFQPFSAMAGALKNRDEVKLVIEVSGKPE